MLAMSGIEASFVVGKNKQNNISISARSRSKINVQRIMEELGGGGHFNLAAAQISDQTIAQVVQHLNEIIVHEVLKDKELKE